VNGNEAQEEDADEQQKDEEEDSVRVSAILNV
jgi:hypothetical protein